MDHFSRHLHNSRLDAAPTAKALLVCRLRYSWGRALLRAGFQLDATVTAHPAVTEEIMDEKFLRSIADRLQRERRVLIDELTQWEQQSISVEGDLQPELQERAQTEVASGITGALDERQQDRLGNIDEALARIEAGTYGECQNCGRVIDEERLEANPTTTFCSQCAAHEQADATE